MILFNHLNSLNVFCICPRLDANVLQESGRCATLAFSASWLAMAGSSADRNAAVVRIPPRRLAYPDLRDEDRFQEVGFTCYLSRPTSQLRMKDGQRQGQRMIMQTCHAVNDPETFHV